MPLVAHVKWFSDFNFSDVPLPFSDLFTTTFVVLAIVSFVVIGALVLIDDRLEHMPAYRRINDWLSSHREHSETIMRVAMAATLLISWENEALLVPGLAEGSAWIGWFQFVLAIALLFRRSAPWAGLGIILLWFLGAWQHGAFHMLDYFHYLGIGVYLYVAHKDEKRLNGIGLPALYATIGFALMWLGIEKLVYPGWSEFIIEKNPSLLLGLPADLFLQGSAFVEIALGFLLIIGLLGRPLAATITLVFITTTLVFGRVEVVGHTAVHAALVVFLLNGPGAAYRPPIQIHERLPLRVSFAAINYALTLLVLAFLYATVAAAQVDAVIAGP